MGRSSLEGHCSRSRGSATPRLWCDHHHIQERVWKPPKHHRGDQGKRRAQWLHPRDITAWTSPASPCFKKCSEQLCQTRSILKKPTSSSDTYIHTYRMQKKKKQSRDLVNHKIVFISLGRNRPLYSSHKQIYYYAQHEHPLALGIFLYLGHPSLTTLGLV